MLWRAWPGTWVARIGKSRRTELLQGYAKAIERLPRAVGSSLNALDFISEASLELVLVGELGANGYDDLATEIAKRYLPNRIEVRIGADNGQTSPLAQGKTLVSGHAALYVCRNFACAAPVTTAAAAAALLDTPGERQESL